MKTLILLSIVSSAYLLPYPQEGKLAKIKHSEFNTHLDPKLSAFKILETKCNACHRTKNPRKVFTLDNMNLLGPKIHKQVFVKRRMPKGKEIRMTQNEYDLLENWLLTLNIK